VRHGEPFLVRWGKALLKRQVKLFGRSPASAINSDQIRALDPLCQFECSFKRTEKKDFLFCPPREISVIDMVQEDIAPDERRKPLAPKAVDRG
jgi:hypothetical protein